MKLQPDPLAARIPFRRLADSGQVAYRPVPPGLLGMVDVALHTFPQRQRCLQCFRRELPAIAVSAGDRQDLEACLSVRGL